MASVTKPSLLLQTMRTVGSMAANQGFQIGAGIIISRIYGPAGKGMVTYAGIAILGVVAIADGLSSAIARSCGDDRTQIPVAQAAILRIILLISLFIAVPLVTVGGFNPAQRALLYVGVAVPFALYVQTMSGFHLIAHRVEQTNIASLVINAGAALGMIVVALAARPPIEIVMSIWTAGYIVGAAIISPGLGTVGQSSVGLRAFFASHARFAIRASSAALMTFLASRIDVFIVAAALSADALGNYTLALAVGELMWQIGRAMAWSAYGRVAIAPFAIAAELTAKITRMVLAIELAGAVIAYIFGPTVLTFVYGQPFAAAGPVLRVLVPGMALYAADSILSYFLSVKVGRSGTILWIETLTLVGCATGSLATIDRFGIMGPAVATTAAYFVAFTVKSVIFTRATRLSIASLFVIQRADFRRIEHTETVVA